MTAESIKIFSTCDYPRPITQEEKEFLIRALGMLSSDEPIPVNDASGKAVNWVQKDDLVFQIDTLVVIGRCQCGDPDCHTIQFQYHRSGFSEKILEMVLEDERILSIYIDKEKGYLTCLEIYKE
jgi:hypothetical protein